jgi:hypothetical protein
MISKNFMKISNPYNKTMALEPKTIYKLPLIKDKPKHYTLNDIKYYLKYTVKKHHEYYYNFKKQGQLKLFLNEIRFLTEDIEIQNFDKEDKFIILYIGSGKGYHILSLIKLYEKYNIKWILYDPAGHCTDLYKYRDINPTKLEINDTYFLEKDIENFIIPDNYKFIFISDIRSLDNDAKEPNTNNLLFDYNIQNNILSKLRPDFSLIKFRMPFPDQWDKSQVFYKPVGKEYLQAFTKNSSTEFRIFLNSIITYQRISYVKTLVDYEEKFSWYNNNCRFMEKTDLLIAIHILNLYNKIENKNVNNIINISNIYEYLKEICNNFST